MLGFRLVRRRAARLAGLLLAPLAAIVAGSATTARAQVASERQGQPRAAASPSAQWEPDIRRFEEEDRTHPPPAGAVLFVGSSSIRLWESLARDFADRQVINRGFGGSELGDVVHFADRIIVPYRPRVIVLYAGDNDLAAGKSPEQVFAAYKRLVTLVRRRLPATRIAYVSIKPSPARRALMPRTRRANALVRGYAARRRNLDYVDVFTPMLDSAGAPRAELFVEDGLHMNPKGYAIWRDAIERVIR